LQRLASTWPQLPEDRRHLLERNYVGLFDERHAAIGGIARTWTRLSQPLIQELDFLAKPAGFTSGIVQFSGTQGHFSAIQNEHQFVKKALIEITRPRHRMALGNSPAVCVHVRLGDFSTAARPVDAIRGNVRQPMEWYVRMIGQIRQIAPETRVHILSDGADCELSPLLRLSGVKRVRFGSSIADLLALSNARVLIASNSTFSMWAAYLGRMPVIWPRFDSQPALHPASPEFEPQVGLEAIPEPTAALIRSRIQTANQAETCQEIAT
jgi:hypothetical protein